MKLKAGRETDAAVAEKLGWTAAYQMPGELAECRIPPGHRQHISNLVPVPRYSTVEADAIAALEATGRMYRIEKVVDYFVEVGSPPAARGQAPTLCLAACAAILQLPAGRGEGEKA